MKKLDFKKEFNSTEFEGIKNEIMKHIKKKYYFSENKLPIKEGVSSKEIVKAMRDDLHSMNVAYEKGNILFLKDTNNKFIWSFIHQNSDSKIIIPLPDMTLVYYNNAYENYIRFKSSKEKFFKNLTEIVEVTEPVLNDIYLTFGYSTSAIIQLFTSIESFVNGLIPDDQGYLKPLKNKTEIYSKEQIEQTIGFEDKVTDVLNAFYSQKIYYENKNKLKSSMIWKLKELRDKIVHTKSSVLYEKQTQLMKEILDFEFEKAFLETKEFMNFYKPSYVEDCDCDSDY